MLERLTASPERPYAVVLGGSKVSDKLKVIEALLPTVDTLLVGGGMCFTFLAAQGHDVGLQPARAGPGRGLPGLPRDRQGRAAGRRGRRRRVLRRRGARRRAGRRDPGRPDGPGHRPRVGAARSPQALQGARTVFWNGPMGVFELAPFAEGTRGVAEAVAALTEQGALTVVGGGDSAAAVRALGHRRGALHAHLHRRRREPRGPRGQAAARAGGAGMSRTPLMAGNWKMNLHHLEAIALVQKLAFSLSPADHDAVEVVVLPPFTDLRSVQTLVDGDRLLLGYGAQDLSPHDAGAHTGDISGGDAGQARLPLRPRRAQRAARVTTARATTSCAPRCRRPSRAGLVPLLCVGEGLEVRRAGRARRAHHRAAARGARGPAGAQAARTLVVAYEPVWAIGTGEVATPDDAQEVCAALRGTLAELYPGDLADGVRVLYGGSVKSSNVAALMARARRRRRPGRRRQPGRRGVRADLPLPGRLTPSGALRTGPSGASRPGHDWPSNAAATLPRPCQPCLLSRQPSRTKPGPDRPSSRYPGEGGTPGAVLFSARASRHAAARPRSRRRCVRWRAATPPRPAAAAARAPRRPALPAARSRSRSASPRTRSSPATPARPRAARSSTPSGPASSTYNVDTSALEYNGVAESITATDPSNWTVKLKPGWTFHDGTPVDAESFVDAWNYTALSTNAQGNSYFFDDIEGYDDLQGETDDDGKVVKEPKAEEMSGLKVVDAHDLHGQAVQAVRAVADQDRLRGVLPAAQGVLRGPEDGFGKKPIGNGPFKADTAFTKGQGITLSRFDAYAGREGQGRQGRDQGLQRHQHRLHRGAGRHPRHHVADPAGRDRVLQGRLRRPLPRAPVVLVHLPRLPDLRPALRGQARPPGVLAWRSTARRSPRRSSTAPASRPTRSSRRSSTARARTPASTATLDVERAKALLAESGFDTSKPVDLWFNSGAGHDAWVQAVGNQLRQNLGIEYKLQGGLDFAQYLPKGDKKGFTGPFRLGWVMDYPSPQNYLEPLYSTQALAPTGSNQTFYSNPAFDSLIAEGNSAATPRGRHRQVPGRRGPAARGHADRADVLRQGAGRLVHEGARTSKVDAFGRIDLPNVTVKQ